MTWHFDGSDLSAFGYIHCKFKRLESNLKSSYVSTFELKLASYTCLHSTNTDVPFGYQCQPDCKTSLNCDD
jgi:hypothetical protein